MQKISTAHGGEVRKGKAMLSNTYAVQENMVLSLAGQRLVKADRDVQRTAQCEKKVGWLPRFLLNRVSTYVFTRLARSCTDDAIWFRGVAQEIAIRCDDEAFDLENFSSSVESHLDSLKLNLRDIRGDLLSFDVDGKDYPKFENARATLLVALTDLFESIENLRWCIMELQASRADHLSGYVANSPEELENMFKSLLQQD